MSFSRPDLSTLKSRIAADLDSRLPGTDAKLRRSNTGVLSTVQAGAVHGLYGYLAFIAAQAMIDTAESEYLERHSTIWGITRKAAAAAGGNVTFTGADGTVIPLGTALQRSDSVEFATDADVTIASGTATVAATTSVAGESGNTSASTALTLINSISGLDSSATVATGGLAGGTEIESDDDLRVRLLARIQQPPHGGANFDYVAWALEVSGVTRSWCYPAYLGLGTVGVTFVCDDQDTSIIPDASMVTTVQDYIDALRPVTADVTVFAPVAVPLNPTIAVTPNTAAVKEAVQAELEDLISREAIPGGTIYLSHIREVISQAAGETNHVLTSPSADVVRTAGQITTLGTITWA
jgi:uncharacterized phage protein gp47/JayE